ncbi:MAG: hypothetical protein II994_04285 [Lachnospiraceae bacterium]|nr:hypothetical protein [Lachnospiraceae bacterium]
MKLKYYLRGLGLGILVSALILGIAGGNRQTTLSDEEIKARAEKLGMVDGSNLTLSQVQSSQEATKESEELPTEANESKELPAETKETEELPIEPKESDGGAEETTEVPEASTETESTEGATAASSETETTEGTAIVTFVIKSGASSDAVSRNLVTAGLVENAKEFDAYLCNNGYSRSLRVGSFEIPTGSTWEEIAKIITGKR